MAESPGGLDAIAMNDVPLAVRTVVGVERPLGFERAMSRPMLKRAM